MEEKQLQGRTMWVDDSEALPKYSPRLFQAFNAAFVFIENIFSGNIWTSVAGFKFNGEVEGRLSAVAVDEGGGVDDNLVGEDRKWEG